MASKPSNIRQILNEGHELLFVDYKARTINLVDERREFHDFEENPYSIAFHRIDTHAKLLAWIEHLSEKTWITTEHLRLLVLAFESAMNGEVNRAI